MLNYAGVADQTEGVASANAELGLVNDDQFARMSINNNMLNCKNRLLGASISSEDKEDEDSAFFSNMDLSPSSIVVPRRYIRKKPVTHIAGRKEQAHKPEKSPSTPIVPTPYNKEDDIVNEETGIPNSILRRGSYTFGYNCFGEKSFLNMSKRTNT